MKETVAIDKPVKMTRCASKDGCVARKTKCKTHDLWHGLERNIYNYLGSISISNINNNSHLSL